MLYKATVFFDQETPGNVYIVDVIEYLGAFWLVPAWFEYPQEKERSPVRIISLLTLPHQDIPSVDFPRFFVKVPISRYVFDGRTPPEKAFGYIVIDSPDVRLTLPQALN